MIRAVLSAHLAPRDMGRLALMMNKRSLGALASTDGHSFVMPAMQECHLVVMLSDLLCLLAMDISILQCPSIMMARLICIGGIHIFTM